MRRFSPENQSPAYKNFLCGFHARALVFVCRAARQREVFFLLEKSGNADRWLCNCEASRGRQFSRFRRGPDAGKHAQSRAARMCGRVGVRRTRAAQGIFTKRDFRTEQRPRKDTVPGRPCEFSCYHRSTDFCGSSAFTPARATVRLTKGSRAQAGRSARENSYFRRASAFSR